MLHCCRCSAAEPKLARKTWHHCYGPPGYAVAMLLAMLLLGLHDAARAAWLPGYMHRWRTALCPSHHTLLLDLHEQHTSYIDELERIMLRFILCNHNSSESRWQICASASWPTMNTRVATMNSCSRCQVDNGVCHWHWHCDGSERAAPEAAVSPYWTRSLLPVPLGERHTLHNVNLSQLKHDDLVDHI